MTGKIDDISNKRLTIGLHGSPALMIGKVQELGLFDQETAIHLAFARGIVHKFTIGRNIETLASDGILHKTHLLLEREGRETQVMKYINSLLEDEMVNGGNPNTILAKCLKHFDTYGVELPTELSKAEFKTKVKNRFITKEMLEPFMDNGRLDLDKAYLVQSASNRGDVKSKSLRELQDVKEFLFIYNNLYKTLKVSLIEVIAQMLMKTSRLSQGHTRNSALTVESITTPKEFYENLTSAPMPFNAITVIESFYPVNMTNLELPEGVDEMTIIVPNVITSSERYLETLDSDYNILLQTEEGIQNSRMEKYVESFKTLVDLETTSCYSVSEKELNEITQKIEQVSDKLFEVNEVPIVKLLSGFLDEDAFDLTNEMEYPAPYSEREDIPETTDLAQDSIEKEIFPGIFSPTVKIDKEQAKANVHITQILEDVKNFGVDGKEVGKKKVIAWGEVNKPRTSLEDKFENVSKEIDNIFSKDNIQMMQDKSKAKDKAYISELNDLLRKDENDQIPMSVINDSLSTVDKIYRYFVNSILGRAEKLTGQKLKDLSYHVLLGDITPAELIDTFEEIRNIDIDLPIVEGTAKHKLAQQLLLDIIKVVSKEANDYRIKYSSEFLTTLKDITPTEMIREAIGKL